MSATRKVTEALDRIFKREGGATAREIDREDIISLVRRLEADLEIGRNAARRSEETIRNMREKLGTSDRPSPTVSPRAFRVVECSTCGRESKVKVSLDLEATPCPYCGGNAR